MKAAAISGETSSRSGGGKHRKRRHRNRSAKMRKQTRNIDVEEGMTMAAAAEKNIIIKQAAATRQHQRNVSA